MVGNNYLKQLAFGARSGCFQSQNAWVRNADASGEIETLTEAYIDGLWYTISRNHMTYNTEGKRTSLENLAGQVTTTAWDCCLASGYNEKSELTDAVAAVDSDYRYSYAFDDIGNREASSERGTNSVYTANQLNQYCSVTTLTSDVGPQTSSFFPPKKP